MYGTKYINFIIAILLIMFAKTILSVITTVTAVAGLIVISIIFLGYMWFEGKNMFSLLKKGYQFISNKVREVKEIKNTHNIHQTQPVTNEEIVVLGEVSTYFDSNSDTYKVDLINDMSEEELYAGEHYGMDYYLNLYGAEDEIVDVTEEDLIDYIENSDDIPITPDENDSDEIWNLFEENVDFYQSRQKEIEQAVKENHESTHAEYQSMFAKEPLINEQKENVEKKEQILKEENHKNNNITTLQAMKESIKHSIVNIDIKKSVIERVSIIHKDLKKHVPQILKAFKDILSIKNIMRTFITSLVITAMVFSLFNTGLVYEYSSYFKLGGLFVVTMLTIRLIAYTVFKKKTRLFSRTAYYTSYKKL